MDEDLTESQSTSETPEMGASPSEPDVAAEEQLQYALAEKARLEAELQAERAKPDPWGPRLRAVRTFVVGFLIVVTCLGAVSSAVAWWVHETLLDTDRYMAIVGPLAQEPAVQEAVSVYTTDQLFTALDVEQRVQDVLPDRLGVLAGPLTDEAHTYIQERVLTLTQTERFQTLWAEVNRGAHEGMVRLVRDEAPNVHVVDGEVRLNLLPVIAQGLERVAQRAAGLVNVDANVNLSDLPGVQDPNVLRERLASRLNVTLPEDFGTVRLMSAEQLSNLQTAVKWLDALVIVLIVVTVLCLAAAIALSTKRRRTILYLGLGILLGLLVARIATNRLEAYVVDSLANSPGQGAARAGIAQVIGNLRSITVWLAAGAAVAVIVAFLAGKPHWFRAAWSWLQRVAERRPEGSEVERWTAAHYDWLRIGGIAVALILLFVWGIGWISVFVLGALLVLYLAGLAALRSRAPQVEVMEQTSPVLAGAPAAALAGAGLPAPAQAGETGPPAVGAGAEPGGLPEGDQTPDEEGEGPDSV